MAEVVIRTDMGNEETFERLKKDITGTTGDDDDVPLKLITTNTSGRSLVSKRRIAKGEVLFEETPLVYGPAQSEDLSCAICSKVLKLKEGLPSSCSGCGLAVCSSRECCDLESSDHAGLECGLVAGISPGTKTVNSVSYWLTVFRALLLKTRDRKRWESLNLLEAHFEDRKSSEVALQNKEKVVPVLRELLPETTGTEVLQICGILVSRCYDGEATFIKKPTRFLRIPTLSVAMAVRASGLSLAWDQWSTTVVSPTQGSCSTSPRTFTSLRNATSKREKR